MALLISPLCANAPAGKLRLCKCHTEAKDPAGEREPRAPRRSRKPAGYRGSLCHDEVRGAFWWGQSNIKRASHHRRVRGNGQRGFGLKSEQVSASLWSDATGRSWRPFRGLILLKEAWCEERNHSSNNKDSKCILCFEPWSLEYLKMLKYF